MGHGKFEEDVLVLTKDSWHGQEDLILPRGTSVDEGTAVSRMEEIVWTTRPLYVEVEPGVFKRFGNKDALTRLPNAFTDGYHVVDSRTVRDYEIVSNEFLVARAKELAAITGWTFEGCGTLNHNEISFVQLRLNKDYHVADMPHERHEIRFLFGDDKAGNSGYAGLQYRRAQCMNTFMVAIMENGVLRVPHRNNPEAKWKLINAQAAEVIKEFEEQNAMLDVFYYAPMDENLWASFVEQTYPLPNKPSTMVEAEQAEELMTRGLAGGIDLSGLLIRGERAAQRYASQTALILRRRIAMQEAYDNHNREFKDSAHTVYAAFQALTYITNHGDSYRGDAITGILFDGQRAKDIKRGFNILLDFLGYN
jgi:hypothetical protein